MALETKIARVEATFCVSVVVKRAEKKCTVVKNALKRIPTCNTWEDLFNDAIIHVLEDRLVQRYRRQILIDRVHIC